MISINPSFESLESLHDLCFCVISQNESLIKKHKERQIYAAIRLLHYLNSFMKQLTKLNQEASVTRCQDFTLNECSQESEIMHSTSLKFIII
jgi:hypothetical protein